MLMVHKSTERARAESGIGQIVHLDSPKEIPEILKVGGYALPRRLGLELDVLPANMYFNCQRLFQGADRVIHAVKQVSLEVHRYNRQPPPWHWPIARNSVFDTCYRRLS